MVVISDCLKSGLILKIRFNLVWDLIKRALKIACALTESKQFWSLTTPGQKDFLEFEEING